MSTQTIVKKQGNKMEYVKSIIFLSFLIAVVGCSKEVANTSDNIKKLETQRDVFHPDSFYYDPTDTLAGKVYQPNK